MKNKIYNLLNWVLVLMGLSSVGFGLIEIINYNVHITSSAFLIIGLVVTYISMRRLFKVYKSMEIFLKSGFIFLIISGVTYLLNISLFKMGPIPANSMIISPWYATLNSLISYSFLRIGIILLAIYLISRALKLLIIKK